MSDSTLRKVWFELKDKEGKSLSSATSVRLPDSADVDDFRDKVKEKCSNKLEKIDADDLKVYTIVDGNPKLLNPDETLDGRGTKGSKLQVEVPLRDGNFPLFNF